jgi:hypothetical protein
MVPVDQNTYMHPIPEDKNLNIKLYKWKAVQQKYVATLPHIASK